MPKNSQSERVRSLALLAASALILFHDGFAVVRRYTEYRECIVEV